MYYYIGIIAILSILIGFAAVNDPASLQGISMAVFWGTILAIALCQARKREVDGNWLVRVMLVGLFIRFGMVFVHLAVGFWFYGGAVDFATYHQSAVSIGRNLLHGLLADTGEPKLDILATKYLLVLSYFMVGPSIVGMFLLSGMIGFLGSYLFLRAFEVEFSYDRHRDRRFLALSLFLLPSLAYWAILLGKDSWIFLFLGLAAYAFVNLSKRFHPRYLLGLMVSLLAITLIRPPVGAVLAFAGGCAWLFKPGQRGPAAVLRPALLAISLVVIAGVTVGIFSSYLKMVGSSVTGTSFIERVIQFGVRRHVGFSLTGGGSSVPIGIIGTSAGAVLGYLPYGMFTFLFRPLVFEAHHALALAAALESTFLLVLVLWRRRNLAAALRSVFTRPFVGFCAATFFLLTAMLSLEANFGVIVRHRTMVLPFLLILLAVPPNPKRHGRKVSGKPLERG